MRIGNNMNVIKSRMKNPKLLWVLIVWFFMLDVFLAKYRAIAMTMGIKDSLAILPHVQNNFYFNKIVLLGGMCFFSDVPYMAGEELYVVLRIGKEKWAHRNCYYILLSGILLSALLTLLSILVILPAVNLKNEWGAMYQTLSLSEIASDIDINSNAMNEFTPYELMLHIFLIDALAFAFMGMLLYTLSLFISKVFAYTIVVLIVFLQSIFGKMGLMLDNFLPFSWISTSH